MYRNNNLHQKLAVSEILNNVSPSLSFGGPIATSCVLVFFCFGLYALCVPMGEGRKTFYTKYEFFFYFFYILYSFTLSH